MHNKNTKGFTLIEMLLVLVIISFIIYAMIGFIQQRSDAMRIDRTSAQLQQILNAGLAYYVDHGTWPATIDDLRGAYLPPASVPFKNPWGFEYVTAVDQSSMFYAFTYIVIDRPGVAAAYAETIAGTLPLSYTSITIGNSKTPPIHQDCTAGSINCTVVASVNIPGQNLNNARAINFAGMYHNGACVPVPQCPLSNPNDPNSKPLVPQIMVVPVSVSGQYGPGFSKVYPISSFTAYAVPRSGTGIPLNSTPPHCDNAVGPYISCTANNIGPPVKAYWRVCLSITTERGLVTGTPANNPFWGGDTVVMALTRCAVEGESSGSDFTVYES